MGNYDNGELETNMAKNAKTHTLGTCPDGWKYIGDSKDNQLCQCVNQEVCGKCAPHKMKIGGKEYDNLAGFLTGKKGEEQRQKWAKHQLGASACKELTWKNCKVLGKNEVAPSNDNDCYDISIIKQNIVNKINELNKEKDNIMNNYVGYYEDNTDELDDKYDTEDLGSMLLDKQKGAIHRNKRRFREIKNDIETLRRQLEIGENQFKRKSFLIFLFKNSFVFVSLIVLVGLLVRNGNISKRMGSLLTTIVIVVFGLIIGANLLVDLSRDNRRFNKRNWWIWGEPSVKKHKKKQDTSSFSFDLDISASIGDEKRHKKKT